MTPTDAPSLLADLRARRLARRLIEIEDRLAESARDPGGDLLRERDAIASRLERAAAQLVDVSPLRAAIEDACRAHRARAAAPAGSDEERAAAAAVAAALDRVGDAMRRAGRPPTTLGAR